MLQHAGASEEFEALAGIWGRRHGANEFERTAAFEVVRAALAHPALTIPAGARRYRELPVIVRLDDGTLVDGRIDFAWSDGASWTVIDYKTDRRERRNVAQVQIYALALQRATGLPVRGIVLGLDWRPPAAAARRRQDHCSSSRVEVPGTLEDSPRTAGTLIPI
jgi:hypothetical protein